MVVDDQDSDANHVTPFPNAPEEQGIPHRRGLTPRGYDSGVSGSAASDCPSVRQQPVRVAAAARPPPCSTATPTPGVVPGCLAP
ncbi:hypothetical protein GCM10010234_63310 [Streptomyces hawaiiensis]